MTTETDSPAEPSTYGASQFLTSLDPEPAPEPEIFGSDVAGLQRAADERTAAERNEVITRHFSDPENPEKIADGNHVVSVKHASESLTAVREEERVAAEKALDAEMTAAIDGLRNPTSPSEYNDAARAALVESAGEQPNHDIQPEAVPEPPKGKLAAALQDPEFRQEFDQQFGQTVAQAEQARQAFHEGVTQAQYMANAAIFDAHPDLIGLTPEELAIALKMKAKADPSIVLLVNKAQTLHGVAQQARQNERQMAVAMEEQYCRAEDAKFEQLIANDPDAKAVKAEGYRIMQQYYGASKADVDRQFSQPGMRTAIVQKMAFDNIKARLVEERTKDALKNNRHRPIPQLQRPGASEPRNRDYSEVTAMQREFNLKPSAKLGAQILAAKRAASR